MTAMHFKVLVLWMLTVVSIIEASAIPSHGEHKSRVIERPLSDEEHFSDDGVEAPKHNMDYDHEAFLGKEEQETFQNLTPDESKERLGVIFSKIDKDQDGDVTESELTDWIRHVQLRYVLNDSERQWKDHITDDNVLHLSWDSYMKRTYGHTEDLDEKDSEDGDTFNYHDMIRRDKRRWARADQDNDSMLTKEEFSNFLHPEESEHMKDIVIDETLEDIDKNKDGVISLEEYIGDMYSSKDGTEEPDWVKTEREQFSTFRDKNKDGQMDRDEVKDWIIPDDYDHASAEAKHLIFESDVNRDTVLSKEEVLEKYDLFVGSQATDFGEALTKHDEF